MYQAKEKSMKSRKTLAGFLVGSVALLALSTVHGGGLESLAGGDSMSSLASGSAGNAAGVIEFCIKNNYLGGDAAASRKDKLMGKAGGGKDSGDDGGYADGAKGLVKTGDGKSVDLGKLGGNMGGMGDMKSKLTKKACSSVLDHAKSLL
jgi:hypothetical protein